MYWTGTELYFYSGRPDMSEKMVPSREKSNQNCNSFYREWKRKRLNITWKQGFRYVSWYVEWHQRRLSPIFCKLYSTNQRNAQFSKIKFNLCCLLHVSNFVGSSSRRQLYMLYGTFYMHRCEQSGG